MKKVIFLMLSLASTIGYAGQEVEFCIVDDHSQVGSCYSFLEWCQQAIRTDTSGKQVDVCIARPKSSR